MTTQNLIGLEKIKPGNPVFILSGEGLGTLELFTGKKSQRAIKGRLTKERCNGQRWAKGFVYLYDNTESEGVYQNLETGELEII